MIISANLTALVTNDYLSTAESNLQKSMKRLSSGNKINTSEDDSVGKAISEKMRLQINGLDRASQNASDGISVIETAEGAINEINTILQRVRELAVQGASSTYDDDDRTQISLEVKELNKEINRLTTDTEFNNQTLLDGNLGRKAYALDADAGNGSLEFKAEVLYTSNEVPAGTYGIQVSGGVATLINADYSVNAEISVADSNGEYSIYTITDDNNFTMKIKLDNSITNKNIDFSVTDMGAMSIQIGTKEGQTMEICIPEISTDVLGISNLDYGTEDGCSAAIDTVDHALTFLSTIRGQIGANQNRLESAISSLDVTQQNLTSAFSRIVDVDMAEEMTNYTQLNVIQQAGISMLSQANQMPEKVLQLLQ